jgi:glycosyltransferase involved in cell wall biosynthesis
MRADLTIFIPAKNEANMLPNLLRSLCKQDYEEMGAIRVIVADAGSTDDTVMAALGFQDRRLVEVISGGLPAVGRNAGARLAATRFLLFLDADVELPDPTPLRRALCRMRRKNLHLATTNIGCSEGGFFDGLLYDCRSRLDERVGDLASVHSPNAAVVGLTRHPQ